MTATAQVMAMAITDRLDSLRDEFFSLGRRTLEQIAQQGRVIAEIYAECEAVGIPVTSWIPENLGLSPNSARNFARVWAHWDELQAAQILPSAVYRLTAPGVPEAITKRLLDKAQTETVSLQEVEQAIAKAQMLGATLAIGETLIEQHGKDTRAIGSAMRSMVEVAREANQRGVVEIDGLDVDYSELFEVATEERTVRRKADHIEAQYSVNEELVVSVHNGRNGTAMLMVDHPTEELLSRRGEFITLTWRERKDNHGG